MGFFSNLLTFLSRIFGALNSAQKNEAGTTTTTKPTVQPAPKETLAVIETEPKVVTIPKPVTVDAKPSIAIISDEPSMVMFWEEHYPDEFKIAKKLNLNRRSKIYILLHNVDRMNYRLVATNSRGQIVDDYYQLPPDPKDIVSCGEYKSSWLSDPAPNGWSQGDYDIAISLESYDGSVIYDTHVIPATVTLTA